MKIYTKTGDRGLTSLLGGTRVLKSHIRIEAYGTVDELNSYIGLLASFPEYHASLDLLTRIQNSLFTIGALLACETDKGFLKLPGMKPGETQLLENAIDEIDKKLPRLNEFILPGGHPLIGHCHMARCICRRAERAVVGLSAIEPVPEEIIIYLNRLSDFLFMLARSLAHDLHIRETPWKA